MDRHGYVKITVDDDICLSIICEVAERCGGAVRLVSTPRLELAFRNVPSPRDALPRAEPRRRGFAAAMRMVGVRG